MAELSFAGHTWDVKKSDDVVGPGPNRFSDDPMHVFVDEEGLHLSLWHDSINWQCSEAILTAALGYGTYLFTVRTPLAPLEKQAVFSSFLYEHDTQEIDMEVSPAMVGMNQLQYVIQPGTKRDNVRKFSIPSDEMTSHAITWTPDSVHFKMWSGNTAYAIAEPLASWTHEGPGIHSPEKARFIFNLWLFRGKEPRTPQGVIISDFTFYPYESSKP